MSAYNLPLEIAYQPCKSTDVAGAGAYMAGFPSIMGAISDSSYIATTCVLREYYDPRLVGVPQNLNLYPRKKWVLTCKGPQVVYAAPGKAFTVGMDVRIYNRLAVAATKSVIAATVRSYDVKTGLLWIDVYSILMGADNSSGELNRIPVSAATVTAFCGKQVINEATGFPRTIATGGTGGSSDRDSLTKLSSRNVKRVMEYMNDFVSPAEGPVDVFNNSNIRTAPYNAATNTPIDHPGVIRLQASASPTVMTAVINRIQGIFQAARVLGSSTIYPNSFWEFLVYIPTLSNATNEYVLEVGGYSNYTGTPVVNVNFRYDRVASTNWRTHASAPGGGDTTTSSATVVATGWNKLKIACNASNNFEFSVNGTLIATMTTPILSLSSEVAEMSAYVRLTRSAGTSPVIEWDYFYAVSNYSLDRG